jgi:hypothetical protein
MIWCKRDSCAQAEVIDKSKKKMNVERDKLDKRLPTYGVLFFSIEISSFQIEKQHLSHQPTSFLMPRIR